MFILYSEVFDQSIGKGRILSDDAYRERLRKRGFDKPDDWFAFYVPNRLIEFSQREIENDKRFLDFGKKLEVKK